MRKCADSTDASLDEIFEWRRQAICRKRIVRKEILTILLVFATVYLLFGVICGVSIVKGDSMTPALQGGDITLFFRLSKTYCAGDIVLVTEEDTTYIKRVVATPGQTVDIVNGTNTLFVDGVAVQTAYSVGKTVGKNGCSYPLTLGEDEYFILGDLRENSVDSRNFGPVTKEQLRGKVLALLRVGC